MTDKIVSILKRGEALVGTIYQTSKYEGGACYAEINCRGELIKSPTFYDEDIAASWISEQFNEILNRKK